MCLLIVLSRVHPDLPLVVAANRDELLDRPAVPMTVLRAEAPRVLGGRDERAGGTWLAVNEAGLVAGLTNRPATSAGRDPSKRSRGELPLALAKHATAGEAVRHFARAFRPSDYNRSWLLVGDRGALYAVDMTGDDTPHVDLLEPGVHVLENAPLGVPSCKVDHVRRLLEGVESLAADELTDRLRVVLADHHVPAPAEDPRARVSAACVHSERYGTRWSAIVTVEPGHARPTFLYADGPPCRAPFLDAPWRG